METKGARERIYRYITEEVGWPIPEDQFSVLFDRILDKGLDNYKEIVAYAEKRKAGLANYAKEEYGYNRDYMRNTRCQVFTPYKVRKWLKEHGEESDWVDMYEPL